MFDDEPLAEARHGVHKQLVLVHIGVRPWADKPAASVSATVSTARALNGNVGLGAKECPRSGYTLRRSRGGAPVVLVTKCADTLWPHLPAMLRWLALAR